MKYVLDSNISLKWVLTEADSDKARRLRGELQNQIHELLAPDVFPVEVVHELAKAERLPGLSQMRRTGADGFTSGRNGSKRVATHVLR